MSREIMIIAKDKNGVISNNIVKIGENGEHIVIKGTKDTFYEIKDMATNRAPDQIYTKRFKNDLKLKINPKGGALDGVGEADVTIENYCANGNCEIVGVHESGEYYQYVPQSGDADLGTTKMADGEFAYQSLGTVEAGGFSPLSALPLAGLAGLGGGGGSKGDTTAPTATAIIKNIDDNVAPITGSVAKGGHTNDTTPTLSGTLSEALGSGEVVAVYRDGVKVGTAAVDSTGTGWSFTDTGVTDGSHIYTVRAEDTAGNKGTESTPYGIIVDTVAPDAPSLTMVTDNYDAQAGSPYWGADTDTGSWSIDNATGHISINGNVNVTSDGKIITNDNTPTLSGTGEAGTIVNVYAENGNLLATTTVGSTGNWSVEVDMSSIEAYSFYSPNGNPGQEIKLNITLTDTTGNESEKSDINFILDTLTSNTPMNISITDGKNTIQTETDGDNFYFTQPSFTISDDFFSYRTISNPMGKDENVSYEEGTEVYITLTNKDTGVTYQIGGPTGPSVVVGSDGTWSANVVLANYGLIDGLYDVEVTIKESSGDTYGTLGTFGIDTHAPKASDISNSTSISLTDAYVNVTLYNVSPIGTYTDSFGNEYPQGLTAQKIIIYRDGEYVGSKDLSHEFSGNYNEHDVTYIDSGIGEGVFMYQVDTVDVAGNHSGLSDKAWVLVDADMTHNLTDVDNDPDKCFNEMVLIGNANNETFTLDNVGFVSIDAKTGTDTFVLTGSGQTLDIAKTTNFEVYNINGNKLIINGDVNADSDHIIINGTSSATVDLGTDWSVSASQPQTGYTIYSNTGSDDLWIQNGVIIA